MNTMQQAFKAANIQPFISCPYCSRRAILVTGATIYPHRKDLHDKHFYQCSPCDAYVGCHPGTTKSFGRLANLPLRMARSKAHAAFDPFWKTDLMTRKGAYTWLAEQLGIKVNDCHIGAFDIVMCLRVEQECELFDESILP